MLAHVHFHSNPSSDPGFGGISIHTIKSTSNNFDGRAKQISPWLVDLTIANDTSYRKAIFLRQIYVERYVLAYKNIVAHPYTIHRIYRQSIDIQHSNIFIR